MPRHSKNSKAFAYSFPYPDYLKPFRELGFEDAAILKLCEGRSCEIAKKSAEWLAKELPDIHQRTAFLFRYGQLEVKKFRILTSIIPSFPEDIPSEKTDEFVGITCEILKRIV